jgi:hypothetical protein
MVADYSLLDIRSGAQSAAIWYVTEVHVAGINDALASVDRGLDEAECNEPGLRTQTSHNRKLDCEFGMLVLRLPITRTL